MLHPPGLRLAFGSALALAVSISFSPLSTAEPVPKGDRILGIDVNEAQDDDYDLAFRTAQGAGAETTAFSLGWDDLETAPGIYDGTILDIINAVFPTIYDTPIYFTLSAIDTNNNRMPADLLGRAWDDPLVLERFRGLLAFVLDRLSETEILSFAIGNEIDIYLGTDAELWRQWRAFYTDAAAEAHRLRPELTVGTTVTHFGLVSEPRPEILATQTLTDVVLLTYYPLEPDFTVHPTSVVSGDVTEMAEAFPGRKIHLLEAGYPSSPRNGSSETQQRDFVREMFEAWDTHRDQIELVSFSWLTDRSPEQVQIFVDYYGVEDPAFAAYLESLGIRTWPGSGADKPAFLELKAQAAARGWPVTGLPEPCIPSATTACLSEGRFRVEIHYRTAADEGAAKLVPGASSDSVLFWFFDPDNWETMVKVLDGCELNERFWVFAAATTDVEYTLTVTDTTSGSRAEYHHAAGTPAPAITDTEALAVCP